MITAVYSYMMYKKKQHQQVWSLLYTRTCVMFFLFGLGSCALWYVRTSCVSRHPVSYIVSAYLVSYCLLVRQQHRFHHPTLRTTSVILVGCIKNSTISSKHDHCCILVQVASSFFFGLGSCPFFFLCCTYVPRVCRVIPCPILLVRTSYHTVFSSVNYVSREHSTAAVGFHFGVPRTIL